MPRATLTKTEAAAFPSTDTPKFTLKVASWVLKQDDRKLALVCGSYAAIGNGEGDGLVYHSSHAGILRGITVVTVLEVENGAAVAPVVLAEPRSTVMPTPGKRSRRPSGNDGDLAGQM